MVLQIFRKQLLDFHHRCVVKYCSNEIYMIRCDIRKFIHTHTTQNQTRLCWFDRELIQVHSAGISSNWVLSSDNRISRRKTVPNIRNGSFEIIWFWNLNKKKHLRCWRRSSCVAPSSLSLSLPFISTITIKYERNRQNGRYF